MTTFTEEYVTDNRPAHTATIVYLAKALKEGDVLRYEVTDRMNGAEIDYVRQCLKHRAQEFLSTDEGVEVVSVSGRAS